MNPTHHRQKSLIISCHAAGMGSILKGAVAGLLYAELTGRTPLIHWNANCKYLRHSAATCENAFTNFYESTCSNSLSELLKEPCSTYPPNLQIEKLHTQLKKHQTSFDELETNDAKHADLLLFPAYVSIQQVIDCAQSRHPISKLNEQTAAEWAAKTYIQICRKTTAQIQQFWTQHFPEGTPVVTVHIRGGDKYQEAIMPALSRYTDAADQFIKQYPSAKVFLASDSKPAVEYLKKHYKERLVTTPAFRTSGRKGVHKSGEDGERIGNEIIFDVECLSKGDHFIGYKESNVYFWVCHLTQNGINKRFTDFSVTSGRKELFLNRHNFKRIVKAKWKGLFIQ